MLKQSGKHRKKGGICIDAPLSISLHPSLLLLLLCVSPKIGDAPASSSSFLFYSSLLLLLALLFFFLLLLFFFFYLLVLLLLILSLCADPLEIGMSFFFIFFSSSSSLLLVFLLLLSFFFSFDVVDPSEIGYPCFTIGPAGGAPAAPLPPHVLQLLQ